MEINFVSYTYEGDLQGLRDYISNLHEVFTGLGGYNMEPQSSRYYQDILSRYNNYLDTILQLLDSNTSAVKDKVEAINDLTNEYAVNSIFLPNQHNAAYGSRILHLFKMVSSGDKAALHSVKEAKPVFLEIINQSLHNWLDEITKRQSDSKAAFAYRINGMEKRVAAIEQSQKMIEEKTGITVMGKFWKRAASKRSLESYFYFLLMALIIWFFSDLVLSNSEWFNPTMAGEKINYLAIGRSILFTTFAIWMVRITSKIAISARHLARDADERSVVANIYSNLKSSELADLTREERLIFFNHIFHRSTTGLVHEDGPITPLDICANIFQKVGESLDKDKK